MRNILPFLRNKQHKPAARKLCSFVYMKIVFALASLLFLASCAKYMDNGQPGMADSALLADSLHSAMVRAAIQKLPGAWVRRVQTEQGDKGYNFIADGRLFLINSYVLKGDSWKLSNDTINLLMHTDKDTIPAPHLVKIIELTDSILALAPIGAPSGYTETYHKRVVSLPKKFSEFFKKEFTGKLQPKQFVEEQFTIPAMFEGAITLSSDNPELCFYLSKDGTRITEKPVREWAGQFPPGNYGLKIMYLHTAPRNGDIGEYQVLIEEK